MREFWSPHLHSKNFSKSTSFSKMSSGSANNSFVTTGSALVFIMTPGIGLFYAGLVRGRHALKVLLISYLCIAVVTIQWFLFGKFILSSRLFTLIFRIRLAFHWKFRIWRLCKSWIWSTRFNFECDSWANLCTVSIAICCNNSFHNFRISSRPFKIDAFCYLYIYMDYPGLRFHLILDMGSSRLASQLGMSFYDRDWFHSLSIRSWRFCRLRYISQT